MDRGACRARWRRTGWRHDGDGSAASVDGRRDGSTASMGSVAAQSCGAERWGLGLRGGGFGGGPERMRGRGSAAASQDYGDERREPERSGTVERGGEDDVQRGPRLRRGNPSRKGRRRCSASAAALLHRRCCSKGGRGDGQRGDGTRTTDLAESERGRRRIEESGEEEQWLPIYTHGIFSSGAQLKPGLNISLVPVRKETRD